MSGQVREIQRVGVLGFGLMGSGIAQACAASGYDTVAHEPLAAARNKGQAAVEKSLGKLAEKDVITVDARDAALARLTVVDGLDALGGCDLVIEAVTEDLEIKNALWRELDGICADHAIFASNTSSLTIAAMAAATSRRDRFIGLHFFNPVPLMPLVEVVRTVGTSDDTVARMHEFVRSLGKQPVAAKDASGFIVNLLLVPYLLDAVRAVERGVASVADIDVAMRLGAGHPMGPLTLLDFIGLDTTGRIGEIMFDEYREPRYAPPPLLRRMVAAGLYGRKSGRGFYDYSGDTPVPSNLGI